MRVKCCQFRLSTHGLMQFEHYQAENILFDVELGICEDDLRKGKRKQQINKNK